MKLQTWGLFVCNWYNQSREVWRAISNPTTVGEAGTNKGKGSQRGSRAAHAETEEKGAGCAELLVAYRHSLTPVSWMLNALNHFGHFPTKKVF